MYKLTQTLAARTAAGAVGAVMAVSLVFGAFVPSTQADELTDLQAQINALLAQLASLEGGSTTTTTTTTTGTGYIHHPNVDYFFANNLYLGSRGTDVQMLQKALNDGGYTVATSGPGSAGLESTYFGPATLAAVKRFQAANGISPAAGYFYPLTRAEFNKRATVTTVTPPTTGGNPTVSGDKLEVEEGNNPDDDFLPEGVIRMPVTVFEVTAGSDDVEIDSVTVLFTGRADEDVIDSVLLLDEDGNIIGDEDSFDSDDEAKIGDYYRVRSGETVEFTVAVNAAATISSSEDGDDFTIEVVEIDADSDVDGLPVEGAEHVVDADEVLGNVEIDIDNENDTIEVGETNQQLASIDINANPDDNDDSVFVTNLRLEQIGNINSDDLENVYLEVDGDEYEASVDGDYFSFDFGSGVELEDGDTEDFDLYGDVVDGASDSIQFQLENPFDLYAVDEDGYGLPVVAGSGGGFTDGDSSSVTTGEIDATSDDEIDDDEISVGDDVVLASFGLEVEGEGVEGGDVTLNFTLTSSLLATDDTLALEDVYFETEDGDVLFSSEDANNTTDHYAQTVQFDGVDLDKMEDEVIVFVKARIDDDVPTGTEITVSSLVFSGFDGEQSGDSIATETLGSSWPKMIVEAGGLEISMSSSPTAQNVADDTDDFHFASIKLDASDSGENVEVDEIGLILGSSNNNQGDISNCRLYDESDDEIELNNDVDGDDGDDDYQFRFDRTFVVDKDDVVTIDLRCDIGSISSGDTFRWDIATSTSDYDLTGENTNNNINPTFGDFTGQIMSFGSAMVEVTEDSTSPSTELAVAGDEVVLGVLQLDVEDGDVTVDKITATLMGTSTSLIDEIVEVYHENERLGSLSFNGVDDIDDVDITLSIDDDEEALITFVGTLSDIGDNEDGSNGTELRLANIDVETTDSGDVITGTSTVTFASVFTYETIPYLAEVDFNEDELEAGENTVLMFSVEADEADELTISSMDLNVTLGGSATISETEVEVFSDSSLNDKQEVGTLSSFSDVSGGAGAKTISFVDGTEYLEIPAGETYYFKVTVIVVSAPADSSVGVELQEDATAGATGNFVWSTPDAVDASVFFNGFEVEGGDSDIRNTITRD